MGGATPKQFMELAGVPLLVHSLRAFREVEEIGPIVVSTRADYLEYTREIASRYGFEDIIVVVGGASRQESVANGVAALTATSNMIDTIELVAVHDGARPLVQPGLIRLCLAAARQQGAAIAAVPVRDTLKRAVEGVKSPLSGNPEADNTPFAIGDENPAHPTIHTTVERENLWQAQTPQVARFTLLQKALNQAAAEGFIGTDEASLLERLGVTVALVAADASNLKITHPDDLPLAAALLHSQMSSATDTTKNTMAGDHPQPRNFGSFPNTRQHDDRPERTVTMERELATAPRIGHGYDVHRLVPERKLILAGVEIPHHLGLLGHSDADVATHALCDAILGALGTGDIGGHFPDSDQQYQGISSLKLLAAVIDKAHKRGYKLLNADLTIIAQRPKLAPHLPQMRENLASICDTEIDRINIKATTTEGLGFAGREEGIAAHATVLVNAQQHPILGRSDRLTY